MERLLMTPGPTNIPREVFKSMSYNIHHRTDEFMHIMDRADKKLMRVFGSKNEILILSCSGTGGLEASVVNMFSPGDKLLCINCGVFGKRYADIARAYGVDVTELKSELGYGIRMEALEKELEKNHYKAVYATYSETSTGIKNDIKEIGDIVKKYDSLFIIDAVSALGCLKLDVDEYGVDVAVAGSQKGLMCPPGLSLISMSDRAWLETQKSRIAKFYFDFGKYKNLRMPYTPCTSLILGLDKALDMILGEGLENVYKRHSIYSKAVKEAALIMNLVEFPDRRFDSEVLTALYVPQDIDEKALRRGMYNRGIVIAGGQGKLKGNIIRIGHIGYLKNGFIIRTIETLGSVLNEMGYKNDTGSAILRAEEIINTL